MIEEIVCPYCGKGNSVVLDIKNQCQSHSKKITNCDTQFGRFGGCGRDFVASIDVNIELKALKIEGEDD